MNSNNNVQQSSRIIGIQFGLLSPESIKKNSVVHIESRDTYINNKPVTGGLFDPRMGVLEPGLICPTDGLTYIDTPGYFGHIELARPVFFIQHLKEILKIIKCICFKCSKLKINKSQHLHTLKWGSSKRWDYISSLASNVKRCGDATEDGCGCKQPDKIKQEGIGSIYAIWENISTENNDGNKDKTKITMKLTPENIIKIFRRISDDDITFMGFSPIWSRPEWMVCSVLPVPPPAVRPSVKHDAQQRSEDDLTHIYSNIIKTNKDLLDKIQNNASPNVIEGLTSVLQYLVAMIVNNKVKGAIPMSQRSGRPLQCISGRLNSKNGRIRGNLMGKRVDFSARSVITGDPNLSIRQLGVPLKIAKNITKPVVVNERNRDFLLKLIQNGPDVHPGAKILEKKNGDSISLRNVDRASIRLENGDIVHRHMMDGDAVLFNRQPSLHRVSMMCHIVKVMKVGDTFRINVGVTKPYNADFDGDEMNMHMPQNVLAETELRHLAAIPYQMISPSGNAPIIGIYQDSQLGSYRFTREKMRLTPRKAMNLLMSYPRMDVDTLYDKRDSLTNFDVLSQIIPPLTLRYSKGSNKITIQNGEYLSGQMEKSVLASTSKGIIHRVYNDYGYIPAANFVDDLQGIITEYMKTSSFSVGISDLIANKKTQDAIIQAVNTQKMEVQSIIQKVHLGVFKNETANSNSVEFEKSINNILNKATEQSGKIGRESLSRDNRFLIIVESGSKGSLVNISQMIACVGQQNVDGKRVPYGFDSRTLPHFTKFDDSETARGFVENSYISGLTAPELFFHAMGGRIGLIDTAVKTSQTGYIQRRLIKSLEDKKVENDMTVRNNMGKIVQFSYGDDGFDSTKVENQTIPLVGMSIEDIYMHYDIHLEHGQKLDVYTKGAASRMSRQAEELKLINRSYIDYMIYMRDLLVENIFKFRDENSVSVPVAFHFIIANISGQLQLGANSTVDITPLEAYELIEFYMTKLEKLYFTQPTPLFQVLYKFYLSPRELLINKRFHRKALELLLETIVLKYKQALVHPGEMVGVIAGQSIGEPTTQLTLNTFHLAGVASKSNVTRGVPRIEEILRLTKNPKNPSLTIYIKDEDNQDRASSYATMLEHTKLVDVVKSVQICFDPNEHASFMKEDRDLIEKYYEFENIIKECNESSNNNEESFMSISGGGGQPPPNIPVKDNKSKWVIRMEFNAETMLDKNITMDDIHFSIQSAYGEEVSCIYSDFNMESLVFRIRLNSDVLRKKEKKGTIQSLDQSDEIYLLKNFQDTLLNSIVLRGISGIQNVIPRKLQNMVIKQDGKYVKKDIWILDTTGTNLLEALAVDFIDYKRTYSNDIREVFNILGIEAARQVIYNEFVEVMEFSGVYINYHHLSLLCDRMTLTSEMVPIFRSGLLNDDIGPLAKATFEVHTEVFLDAARHGEFDDMRGVSANVMCGQYGKYGTNMFNVILDMTEMMKLKEANIVLKSEEDEIEELFGYSKAKSDDSCSKNEIEIHSNISSIMANGEAVCDDGYDMGF